VDKSNNNNETGKLEKIQDTNNNNNILGSDDRFLFRAKGFGIFVLLTVGVGFSVICFLIEKFSWFQY
jgi:hypothetical protein